MIRMPSTAAAMLLAALLCAAPAVAKVKHPEPAKRMLKIQHYLAKGQEAYDAQRWDESIGYYNKALALRPIDCSSWYNLACCEGRKGDASAALSALKKSVEYGWDGPQWMDQDPDLANVRANPQYASLRSQAENNHNDGIAIYIPSGIRSAAPLVVALHPDGSNGYEYIAEWKQAADKLGVVIVAPRGPTQIARQVSYGWMSPSNPRALSSAAASTIDAAINRAKRDANIDDSKIILAGVTKGGAAALEQLALQPDRFCGAVTFNADYRPEQEDRWAQATGKNIRGYVMAGKASKDWGINSNAADEMKAAGLEVKFAEVEYVGAWIPADYPDRLVDGLRFVLGK